MIVLDSCCFCIPLRVGCLIIGYINLVKDVLLVISSIMMLIGGVAINQSANDESDAGTIMIAISVVILILVTILLIFTIVLLVGLHKEKRGHVMAYLIYALVFLTLYMVLFIATCCTTLVTVGYIVGTIAEILLSFYFLLVFRSHYVKMDGNNFDCA